MKHVSNAFCTLQYNCLNDIDCRHCGYGKMLDRVYQQGRTDAIYVAKNIVQNYHGHISDHLIATIQTDLEKIKGDKQ